MSKGIVLVTGSSGRLGTRVVERFHQHYQVIGFDRDPPEKDHPGEAEHISMDLSSDESVSKGFAHVREKYGTKIAGVVHLAAYYSFTGAHPELYQSITVEGTGRLLKELQNFECDQFLFSSTQLVYKPCALGRKINDDSPVDAAWDYPKSKVKTEKLMHENRGNIKTVALRIAGCYDDDCHSIPISNQIQRIYENQLTAHLFPGDLAHGAPFIHFDDVIDSIWLSVEKRHELPDELLMLISEEQTLSTDQMQRRISKLISGNEMHTFRIPKWFAKLGAVFMPYIPGLKNNFIKPWMIDLADQNFECECVKARKYLGWEPKNFVGDKLPKMINDLLHDPVKFYTQNGLTLPKKLK